MRPALLRTLVSSCVLASLAAPAAAVVAGNPSYTLDFSDAIQGRTFYDYDADGNGIADVVLTTSDRGGFNTFGPGLNMRYIQEPGIEGTALLQEDLRVNFLNGALGSVSFSYALNTASQEYGVSFALYDVAGQQLASIANTAVTQPLAAGGSGSFPENRVTLAFDGQAAYGTFNFGTLQGAAGPLPPGDAAPVLSQPSRYIIDNLSVNFAGDTLAPGLVGAVRSDPILPSVIVTQPDGSVRFDFSLVLGETGLGVAFPVFIDPVIAVGYDYSVGAGPNVASILIPAALANGDASFTLVIDGVGSFALQAGVEFNLLALDPLGFSRFRITGIDTTEALDPNDPQAFVTGLRFVTAGAVDIQQTALTLDVPAVPEPATYAMFALGGLALLGVKRRRAQAQR